MKRVTALFIALILMVGLCACSKKVEEPTWQEQYDLGVRYLSEGNYQEAIIAFEAAITIDPQQADGYIHLAEAYMHTNDFENATRIVNQGVEACGESDYFTLLLNQIQIEELLQSGITGNMLRREELTFFGHNVDTLSFQESTEILQQRGYRHSGISEEGGDFFSVYAENDVLIEIKGATDTIGWRYLSSNERYSVGIREISTCDTMADVFTKLGFSNGQELSDCIIESIGNNNSHFGEYDVLTYSNAVDTWFLTINHVSNRVKLTIDFHDPSDGYIYWLDLNFGRADSFSDCLILVELIRMDSSSPVRGWP